LGVKYDEHTIECQIESTRGYSMWGVSKSWGRGDSGA
jgi:hypothetical protein